jgi:endonuclease YncB( thermonuclease family)
MRILVVAWALVFCASAQAQQVGSLISGDGAVVDGDTFDIRGDRIRIWGIDAPEGWATDYPGCSGGHYAPLEAAPKAAKRGLWQCEDRPPKVRWCKRGDGVPCERPIYKPSGPA